MQELVILQRNELRDEISHLLDKKLESFLSLLNSPPLPESEDLLSRKEAAKYLGVSLTTLWAWTNEGIIPGHRVSSRVRYKRHELDKALSQIKTR